MLAHTTPVELYSKKKPVEILTYEANTVFFKLTNQWFYQYKPPMRANIKTALLLSVCG